MFGISGSGLMWSVQLPSSPGRRRAPPKPRTERSRNCRRFVRLVCKNMMDLRLNGLKKFWIGFVLGFLLWLLPAVLFVDSRFSDQPKELLVKNCASLTLQRLPGAQRKAVNKVTDVVNFVTSAPRITILGQFSGYTGTGARTLRLILLKNLTGIQRLNRPVISGVELTEGGLLIGRKRNRRFKHDPVQSLRTGGRR